MLQTLVVERLIFAEIFFPEISFRVDYVDASFGIFHVYLSRNHVFFEINMQLVSSINDVHKNVFYYDTMTPSHLPGPEPYKFKLPTSPIGQWTLKLKADKDCICKSLTDKTKSLLILQPSSWYICTNVVNFEELLDPLVFGFGILVPFKWYSFHTFTSHRY